MALASTYDRCLLYVLSVPTVARLPARALSFPSCLIMVTLEWVSNPTLNCGTMTLLNFLKSLRDFSPSPSRLKALCPMALEAIVINRDNNKVLPRVEFFIGSVDLILPVKNGKLWHWAQYAVLRIFCVTSYQICIQSQG